MHIGTATLLFLIITIMLKFVFNLLVQSCCFIIFPEVFMVRCLEVMRMDTVYPKEGEL